jgi:pimeloyl-ACP methyl ester carboxylesterase
LLDALGLDEVDLISHQWGAWTGFFACLEAPERFRHHLALSVVHPWPQQRYLAPAAWRFWFTTAFEIPRVGRQIQRRCPGFTRLLLRRGAANPSQFSPETLDEYCAVSQQPGVARSGELLHRSFIAHDIPALLLGRNRRKRLEVPTLLLTGQLDPVFTPRMLRGMSPSSPLLRHESIPSAGHWLPEERPDEVASAARTLFATDPSDRRDVTV